MARNRSTDRCCRIVRKGNAYPCGWPAPSGPWPDSITRAIGFRDTQPRSFMEPDEGTSCPTFEAVS